MNGFSGYITRGLDLLAILGGFMLLAVLFLGIPPLIHVFSEEDNVKFSFAVLFSSPVRYTSFSFKRKIAFFFTIVLLALGILFIAFQKNRERTAVASGWVEHTQEVLFTTQEIYSLATEMQSGTRGYAIAGDENYLPLFNNAEKSIGTSINYLQTLLKDNPAQQRRADTLKTLVSSYIITRKELVNARRDGGFDAAQVIFLKGDGKLMFDQLRATITVIKEEQNQLLAKRKEESRQKSQNSSRLSFFLQAIIALLLLIALLIIYNNTRARDKAEGKLKQSEEKLSIFFNSIDEGFCVIEMIFDEQKKPVDYRFLVINPSFEKQTGLRDAVGKRMREFAPDHEEHWFEIYGKIALTGESLRFENRAEQLGRWYDVYAFRFGDPANMQVAILFNDITERKQVHDTIQEMNLELEKRVEEKAKEVIEKEKQYRFLLQNMREGIQVIGYDWRYLFVNSSVVGQSKYSNEELLGHTMMEKYPGIENTELFWVLQRCMKERKPELFENEFTFPNGAKEWYELSIQPVPEGIFILSMDITERKKTDNELRDSLKEISDYKYAINESSIVAFTDQKGIITHVNDNFCKISKYSREELLGRDHRIINSGYHPKEFIRELWVTIANGEIWRGELKNKARDGSIYWVDTTIIPFLNNAGKPFQYLAIRSDITNRKETEEMLIASENRFRSIIEQFPYPVVTYTPDGTYTNANKAWETMWQYKREDVKGYNIRKDPQMIASGLSVYVEKAFAGEVATSEPYLYDPKQIGHDSPKRWMQMTLYPLKNAEGKILEVILILLDITSNKEAEEKLKKYAQELQASNTELERFAYVASHDLQEPLRMVSSFLNLLEEEFSGKLNETAREYIHFAVDGAGRMKKLVNDLLQYSRVGNNKEEFSAINLNEIMDYAIRVLDEDIKKRNAKLKVKPLPVISANKALIGQLFINLLSNALKYHGDKRPEIEMGYTDDTDSYIFYIKDNGIGIDPKFFDKIFIIFQRLHNKNEYSGTGIGLAICKKIVETHKGKIWVESMEGNGSTFYVSIPKHYKP